MVEKVFVRKFEKELKEIVSSRSDGVARFIAAAKTLKVEVRIEKILPNN